MRLDTGFARALFPAFSEPSLRDWAFFENAGGSFACRHVVWRLNRFYKERHVQPYGTFPASQLAGEEMSEARDRIARLLGVATDEVSFGPSTTQNAYVLAQAFGAWLSPGDAIVVTEQDHEANSTPWRRLAARGIEIREWAVDPATGSLDTDALDPLLEDERVRLVCFPHASNIVGEINPVAQIARQARRAGALTCVDGVSYAPHALPNVGKLGCDIYLFSAYKTYGPHQGIMVVRRTLAERLPNQGFDFNGANPTKRFTPAGPDHAQVAACAGIADYVDALYKHHFRAGRDATARAEVVGDLFRAHETELLERLLDYLSTMPGVRVLGPADAADRAPTVALALTRPGEDAARELSRFGIMAGGGDFYAPRVLDAMGVDPALGVLRLSFVHYTTEDDIDRLIAALDHVL